MGKGYFLYDKAKKAFLEVVVPKVEELFPKSKKELFVNCDLEAWIYLSFENTPYVLHISIDGVPEYDYICYEDAFEDVLQMEAMVLFERDMGVGKNFSSSCGYELIGERMDSFINEKEKELFFKITDTTEVKEIVNTLKKVNEQYLRSNEENETDFSKKVNRRFGKILVLIGLAAIGLSLSEYFLFNNSFRSCLGILFGSILSFIAAKVLFKHSR